MSEREHLIEQLRRALSLVSSPRALEAIEAAIVYLEAQSTEANE